MFPFLEDQCGGTCGGFQSIGVPQNHPFEIGIVLDKPSIDGNPHTVDRGNPAPVGSYQGSYEAL